MKTIVLYIAVITAGFIGLSSNAQTKTDSTEVYRVERRIENLNKEKETIKAEEREALKKEVEMIEDRLAKGEITLAEAETQKKEAARRRALNIENRISIVDSKIALLERNGLEGADGVGRIEINLGGDEDDDHQVFGVFYEKDEDRPVKYDRRTTSDLVIGIGFNNAIGDDQSLEDSDFKIAGSRFFELGVAWKTRVFKNSNWLRFKYGFSFQFNGLKPTDNRIYEENGDVTELVEFPLDLDKSKFRNDNLVFPIHFEFGPSKRIEKEDRIRYSTDNKLHFGIGGYGGLRLSSRMKYKFDDEDGDRVKEKVKGNFNANDFVYGLSSYVGWNGVALYAKYDLNDIFENDPNGLKNISLGVRFDID
ncbi:hypothetical protein GCM10009117_24460 [Gangjinia marincola]|uniref:PorT family protein n=1 Tax=Gangjinia marincola TaxID=578463 RepID=A0ABP3XY77_9FLAO